MLLAQMEEDGAIRCGDATSFSTLHGGPYRPSLPERPNWLMERQTKTSRPVVPFAVVVVVVVVVALMVTVLLLLREPHGSSHADRHTR